MNYVLYSRSYGCITEYLKCVHRLMQPHNFCSVQICNSSKGGASDIERLLCNTSVPGTISRSDITSVELHSYGRTLCRRFRFSGDFDSDMEAVARWWHQTEVGCIAGISIFQFYSECPVRPSDADGK